MASSGKVEEYIEMIVQSDNNYDVANDVLKSIRGETTLSYLDEMLCHSNTQVVEVATWVLAELADDGAPLLHRVRELKNHCSDKVRFFCIDAIAVNATARDQDLIAWALDACRDESAAVRWKSMVFMHDVSESKLMSVLEWMSENAEWREHAIGIRGMLSGTVEGFADLTNSDVLNCRVISSYVAATAARYVPIDSKYLRRLAKSDDGEIGEYASDMLDRYEVGGR